MTSSRRLGLADLSSLLDGDTRPTTGTTRAPVKRRPARSTSARPTPAVMARPHSTDSTPAARLVSGTVTYFNEEKGFGFASAIVDGVHQKVFFHVSNAREAAGTADAPELTNSVLKDVYVTAAPPRPSEIIMIVRPSSDPSDPHKKATAAKWGFRPKRDWRQDAINFDNGYADYVGGHITILPQYGSYGTEEFRGGTIQAIKLTPGEINLVIANADYYDLATSKWTKSETVAICYKLKYAYLDPKNERTPERNRRKVIIAPSMQGKDKQIRLTLNKPAHKAPEA